MSFESVQTIPFASDSYWFFHKYCNICKCETEHFVFNPTQIVNKCMEHSFLKEE